jgi:hypothetical protein
VAGYDERPGVAVKGLRDGAGGFGFSDLFGNPRVLTRLANGYLHDALVDTYLKCGAAVK